MKSAYRRLGDYIKEVNTRNSYLTTTKLLGVNIDKFFMPSVANVIGTDMSVYKIVSKGQFACNRMHVGRDYRLPVALSESEETFLVSPAYDVFEVLDTKVLLPEYLMMWFSRAEFDRNAWFYTDADVRGGLHWKAFCDMELPVPDIDVQHEIVKEYHSIVNRIKLNEQLNQKLEQTAQSIYKQWFIDFEFPDESGKPYKSNGGKMVWCEELKQEIPENWEHTDIQGLIDRKIIYSNQDGNHGEIHPKSSDYVSKGVPFIMAKDINYGVLDCENCSFISVEQSKKLRTGFAKTGDVLLTHKATMGRVAIVPQIKNYILLTPQVTYFRVMNNKKITKEYLYCLFNSMPFQNVLIGDSEQSTRNFLSISSQRFLKILLPSEYPMEEFKDILNPILQCKILVSGEIKLLNKFKEIIFSKMSKPELLETEQPV